MPDDTHAMHPTQATDAKPFSPRFPSRTRLQTAVAEGNLLDSGLDATQLDGAAVGQIVHGGEANVEASPRVVNSQDVDRLAVVRGRPACAAVGRVPAADGLRTADVWELVALLARLVPRLVLLKRTHSCDIALDVPVPQRVSHIVLDMEQEEETVWQHTSHTST
jgi:hypothetical protein